MTEPDTTSPAAAAALTTPSAPVTAPSVPSSPSAPSVPSVPAPPAGPSAPSAPSDDHAPGISPRQRAVALLVSGCFFMENLDGTIVSTAAPKIGASLGVSATAIGLVVTAYLLTLGVLIPLSGWLTARLGARTVFLSAIVLFTAASAACACAHDLGTLVALRVVQGAGGAMMVPVGRLTAMAGIAKPDIPRIVSYMVWPALLAPVAAPLLGGVISTYADWQWMFLVNVPLGAVAFGFAWRLVHGGPTAGAGTLDWPGVLWTSAGLGTLTYTGHLLSDQDAAWGPAAGFAAVSAVLLVLAVRHLRRTRRPLVDLGTLEVRTFRSSVWGGTSFWLAVAAVPFLLPLLFQEVFGWSAVRSGSLVLFVFVGNIGIKPATGWLFGRFGYRSLLAVSGVALAGTMAACAFLTAGTPLWLIAVIAVASGAARSLGLTGYSTLAFADVPADRMRDANTLNATVFQTAAGLSVAAAGVALRLGGPLTHGLFGHTSLALSYGTAFLLLALGALGAAAGALRLPAGAGDALRRRPVPPRTPAGTAKAAG
ncbi:MFS transporter [Actinacidiphila yeochonensis]|uniref:MFS transporter n=1 Tax=Actinacidiphila yeochonensis TaxID=89050 RepID=UPI000AEE2C79|nr:MFS transporter [Actinacidiphila yeochonensis]